MSPGHSLMAGDALTIQSGSAVSRAARGSLVRPIASSCVLATELAAGMRVRSWPTAAAAAATEPALKTAKFNSLSRNSLNSSPYWATAVLARLATSVFDAERRTITWSVACMQGLAG